MCRAPITVCFPFIGDEIGGSHISAIKLIEALNPSLVRPLIALQAEAGPVADYLRERRLPYLLAPGRPLAKRGDVAKLARSIMHVLCDTGRLTRFLTDNAVDVVHTNDGRTHAQWMIPARLAGARHIWHHRGDPDALGVNYFAPIVSDHVITVSSFARPRHPIIAIGSKLSVVHSPFDVPSRMGDREAARAQLLKALNVAPETRFLGYFGLLIERKRPIAFVEAVAAFVEKCPDIPVMGLVFGVPGTESPHYDRLITERARALGIEDQIRLMGFRQPVEPWMQAMDALLVPAVREPFGRTLIEAMFLGTPVVATSDGGNLEAIEHGVTGYLVPPDEPAAFVEPVRALLVNERQRHAIVDAARARALASYSVERHVAELTAIYRACVFPGESRDVSHA
ncbi:glycosyltransferase family 4 protein [Rhodoligotrophos ferricapiens]|uniref:glycosyltransferase family 4 protein n=1 Tax=Rhodoligotrophos ferricapiens TaxID=3069264 RepID=UPI00315DF3BC